jgi:hypothetical protein
MIEPIPTTDASQPFGSVRAGDAATAERFDAAGIVEEEFFFSGTADALDGDGCILAPSLDYTTRILVRRPAEPTRFSGFVFIEPFHHIVENPIVYRWISDWLLDRGHAWIGVTVHTGTFTKHYRAPGGVPFLQQSDPDRYARLRLTPFEDPPPLRMHMGAGGFDPLEMRWSQMIGHAQGLGIVASLAKLVKTNDAASPLHDLDVRFVCGTGASQTGNFWRAFIDWRGDDAARLPGGDVAIDAYLTLIAPPPDRIPDDAIFVHVLSEAEVVGTLNPRMMTAVDDRDSPQVRGYEITGAPHMLRSEQIPGMDREAHPAQHTDEPHDMLVRAVAENLVVALRDGTPMPPGARITREARSLDGVARDEHGNAIGGLRAPWIEIPTAQYLARCSCSPTTGEKIPFTDQEIARLYGNSDALRAARSRSIDDLVERRLLLPVDAAALRDADEAR